MTNRQEVYKAIDGERDYQDNLGSDRVSVPRHTHKICEEIVMMRQYLDKAEKAWVNNPGEVGNLASLNELRKVTSMGVRCMENHGAPVR
jgi:hypothetical protein